MDNLNIRNFESIGQLTGGAGAGYQRRPAFAAGADRPCVTTHSQASFLKNSLPKSGRKPWQSRDYQLLTRLGHEFAPENSTLAVQKDKESTMQAVYQQLTELHRYLLAIQNAPCTREIGAESRAVTA
ncbi:IcmF-like protein [Escherichia coli]|uniref:IcmF-like protein n=1 Tax=Escherichia coli TaxID=562 RepID=A0A377DID8_ECOLX|nr:IcmF-like protein [Escherichia coli]